MPEWRRPARPLYGHGGGGTHGDGVCQWGDQAVRVHLYEGEYGNAIKIVQTGPLDGHGQSCEGRSCPQRTSQGYDGETQEDGEVYDE
jgi:hypothetical protein